MAGTDDLQAVLREAAATLGKRTLGGKQLVWKPGMLDQLKTNIGVAQMLVNGEHRTMLGSRMPGISSDDPPPPPGATAVPQRPLPPTAPTRPRSGNGPPPMPQRAGWTAAKPQPVSTERQSFLGRQRQLFKEVGQAALKTGTVTGIVGLLHEGALSGGDILLDPDFSVPTLARGVKLEAGPSVEYTINGIADLMMQSGLVGNSTVESGKEIAGKVASCLPVIGAVLTLSEAALQTVQMALDISRNYTLAKTAKHVTPGQPLMAVDAARSLFQRHAAEMGARMAINYTAGGASVAGLFLDFGAVTGPLAGIIKSVLNLAITIVNTCITLTEMRRGNEILRGGFPEYRAGNKDDARKQLVFLFDLLMKCPILGAYMLTEGESSVLYAFLVSGPLPKNWEQEFMRLKPKMDELITNVNVLQLRSPFLLAGGSENGSFAKGDHFLNMSPLRMQQRLLHEANLTARRDPKAVGFIKDYANATTGGGLPRIPKI